MSANRYIRGRRRSHAPRAFTLIELLVVVAIVALLMSLLLPSMSKAREQAKSVKCLSNLGQIGRAMLMYFGEASDWFPFEKHNHTPAVSSIYRHYLHGFYYGGHPGRMGWWGYSWDAYRDTPGGRPFNTYLYPGLPMWNAEPNSVAYEVVRHLPVYECPSDRGGFWNGSNSDDPWSTPLHRDCGSSYDFNYHFVLNWAIASFGAENPPRWLNRSNAFLGVQRLYHSARFIMLYEDPFDSAQWLLMPRRGWHRQWNRHNVLFLDAHAAMVRADTAKGVSGLGWKTCSGSKPSDPNAWWNNAQDPDYRYRGILGQP